MVSEFRPLSSGWDLGDMQSVDAVTKSYILALRRDTHGLAWTHETSKSTPGHTSSNKATLFNPSNPFK